MYAYILNMYSIVQYTCYSYIVWNSLYHVLVHIYTLFVHTIITYVTKRSRSKSTLSTNFIFYIREPSIFKKITDPPKISTYVQYLTALTSTMSLSWNLKNTDSTPQPPENGEILISTDSTPPSPTNYQHIIAHAAEPKFINNRYTTPITVEFGSSESENFVNLPVKHRKFFIEIKLLDPSTSITIKRQSHHKPSSISDGNWIHRIFRRRPR